MKIAGIVVEYNPLHHGHIHHYNETKKMTQADAVIAVMSGNFLQRGEPAIVDKWTRTEMALHMGVDLVLELPVAYATHSAQWFAYGAVASLHATGVVNELVFGMESDELEVMKKIAQLLSEKEDQLKSLLADKLATGMSYPAAFSHAAACLGEADKLGNPDHINSILTQPNNSLALHYLMALYQLDSPIVPRSILRQHASYHDVKPSHERIASATAIRKTLLEGRADQVAAFVPDYTLDLLKREIQAEHCPMTWEHFAKDLWHELILSSPNELQQYQEIAEGLEYRILNSISKVTEPSVAQLLTLLKTKRYTHTKLQRALLHILLRHSKRDFSQHSLQAGPPYLRVLGFNEQGRTILKRMKKTAAKPVVTRAAGFQHPFLQMDIQATAIYYNAMKNRATKHILRDFNQPPIML